MSSGVPVGTGDSVSREAVVGEGPPRHLCTDRQTDGRGNNDNK